MSALGLLDTLGPAVALALIIRLDSRLIGPYWSFSELLGGMGGLNVFDWYDSPRIRWGFWRRFAWPVVVGGVAALIWPRNDLARGAVIGALAWGLMVWPAVYFGLPREVSRSDWWLFILYASVLVGFAAGSFLGTGIIDFARGEVRKSGVVSYLRQLIFPAVIILVMRQVFVGSFERLEQRRRQRGNG